MTSSVSGQVDQGCIGEGKSPLNEGNFQGTEGSDASLSVVDAHCHLDDFFQEGPEALTAVLARAQQAGVKHLVVNGLWQSRPKDFGVALKLAHGFPDFLSATVAIQPHDLRSATEADFSEAERLAFDSKVVAIGETGLEYHYDVGPRQMQMDAMAWHIRLAQKVHKPLILHIRDGHADALEVFRQTGAEKANHPTQIHCFSGTVEEGQRWIDLGCFMSFSGMLTFRRSVEIQEVARRVPIDRLLVETDSPYLAPIPLRGKRCEPAFVRHTLQFLAKLRDMDPIKLGQVVTDNARRLFGLPRPALPMSEALICSRIRELFEKDSQP